MFATTKAVVGSLNLPEFTSGTEATSRNRLAIPATLQPRLRRMAQQLAAHASLQAETNLEARANGVAPQAFFFGEVSSQAASSEWVTEGVAAELQGLRQAPVSVLALAPHLPAREGRPVGDAGLEGAGFGPHGRQLTARHFEQVLESQLREDSTVLVHTADALGWAELPVGLKHCAGFVLMVRANRTRRAAIEAVQRKLARLEVPLLGAVVLDREYPIPDSLYRWL